MEKYESGWLLSVLRLDSSVGNQWFFLSPEEASGSIDYANLSPIDFKKIRPLIKQSQLLSSVDIENDAGLPLVSVYAHKRVSA